MTENIYIKFKVTPDTLEVKTKNRRWTKIIKTILFFIPKGNSDFDDLIGDVAEWQLEIDPNSKLPSRELGKDINGKIILIMPWLENYGYWTDNEITLDYFKEHFKANSIDKSEFNENWNTFSTSNS